MARAAIATPVSDGEAIETLWRCMSAVRVANGFPRRRTEVAFCQTTGLVHIKKGYCIGRHVASTRFAVALCAGGLPINSVGVHTSGSRRSLSALDAVDVEVEPSGEPVVTGSGGRASRMHSRQLIARIECTWVVQLNELATGD